MKRFFHILLKTAGVLLLLLLLLAGLLQTPYGKQALASILSNVVSRPDGIEVRIGRIRGWVPMDMEVERVEIDDASGTWLMLEQLHARWVLKDLFNDRLRLTALGAREVHWMRFPKSTALRRPQKPRSGGWPDGAGIVLEGWSIDRLKLGRSIAGVPLEYAVRSGGIIMADSMIRGDLALEGDAEGSVDFRIAFEENARRTLSLQADLGEIRKPAFGPDRLAGTLTATMDAGGISASLEADLAKGEAAGRLSTRLHYASKELHLEAFHLEGKGCETDADLKLVFSRGRIDAAVKAVLTDANARRHALEGTAGILSSNRQWSVQIPRMSLEAWEAMSVSVSGSISPAGINMKADLAGFELGTFPHPVVDNFTGRVSGTASVAGTLSSPLLDASLSVTGFSSASDTLDELPRLDFGIAVNGSREHLGASVVLANSASGYLAADVRVPCCFSIMPFRLDVDSGKLDGSLDAFLDLDLFNGLSMMENQHVQGLLSAELDLKDSVPSGFIYLEDGSYEHYSWGILFRDFQAELEAAAGGLFVRSAAATDGASGRLKLSGGWSEGALALSLDLDQARVIRRPDITAGISGRLGVSGPLSRPQVEGKLVVDRADLLPDNILSARPRMLENYDAEAEADTAPHSAAPAEERRPWPVGLNIKLKFPDQVYITASLIDSVWGGSLLLQDSADGLLIKGAIEPRRGYVNFIGKKFRLLEGSVEMDSEILPVPVMNSLTAEYARTDISARLILDGSIMNPQYRLESTPALPEDEVLSQILFNRDAGSITPYQAVQIALAARQLSGGLSGPGFLYQFRQAVGVDTLEWREAPDQETGSSVAAGKYITPELYVEVSSTFGAEAQTDMTAEYEINRHFSVETSAAPNLRPGIGLNWKNDY